MRDRFMRMHPTVPVAPVSFAELRVRYWLLPATESLIALVACFVVVAALVLGGRRWWATLTAAMPLSVFLGIGDTSSLGLAWMQPFNHMHVWLETGAVVDAGMLLVAVAVMSHVLPHWKATTAVIPAVVRTLPIAIIAFGWWLIGHALPDPSDRVFVSRTLLLVLVAAVVMTLQLPMLARIALLFVLPFADPNLSDGLILGYTAWSTYLHQVSVAAATALYVGGMPYAVARLRRTAAATAPA